jgi:two-component system, cell cycle sensor histidine kinase and response regulator CckA
VLYATFSGTLKHYFRIERRFFTTLSPTSIAPATVKILIVEDEGIIAAYIASQLALAGYTVAGIAQSAEEMLASVSELRPELILMDIHIKGPMDGIETAAALRDRFDIPVIYLTAHTDQETINRAKLTGASGFLAKPIHSSALQIAIEMALQKHRADRVVKQQRAWMATVLNTMANAIVVIDNERKVRFLNGLAEELTGWTNQDAQDRDIALILPLTESRSDRQTNEILYLPAFPQPPSQMPRGLTTSQRSGKKFPIEGEIAPSVDGKRVVGAVITFRDATSRLAQEDQVRHEYKMQAVGRLAAGIAHDFNNLLCIILGYTEELLTASALNDSDLRALTEVQKAGTDAANITRQLLKFSRKEPVEKQDVNLNEVIRDTEPLLRRLGHPSAKWQLILDPNLGVVRAENGQLKQVLMNLVANAHDAMPHGGSITIETANVEAPRAGTSATVREAFVSLSVADTGIGMSAEAAERLFEPFFTTKELGKGTGLGLSIVDSIITDLGGTIHVDSEPGKGATFTVYIPRVGTANSMPVIDDPGSVAATEGPTVLLVEDHEAVRSLVRNFLTSAGYRVLEAEDGEEGVRIGNEYDGAIDLLITDMMMPKSNGSEVARALSSRREGMKIIVISGHAAELVDALESFPVGARFLPKPFVRGDLLQHVSDLLGPKISVAKARHG